MAGLLDDEELLRSQLKATPRNKLLGLLSDFVAQSYSPQRTQQLQGTAKFLGAPAISQTLDRLSYGEPLTTGAGGLGGTTRIRPEALEAAMTVAPMVGPAARAGTQAMMATGRAGERLAERVVPQIMERGGLPAELLQGMSRGTVSPLDVYHGSPHQFPPTARNPLGEFDASKIGTGEGAQAYGHGIYTAEAPAVAKGYMSTLGGNLNTKGAGYYPKINGKVVYDDFADLDIVRKIAAATDAKLGGIMGLGKRQSISSDDAIAELIAKNKLIADNPVYFPAARSEALNEIQVLSKYLGKNIEPSKPTLYKVDLPDKMIPKMLDYDRQLSEQSVEVQKILLPYQKEIGGSFGTGEQTLKAIAFERRMKGLDDSPVAVAQQLKEMGIPGIRYLDEKSRSNFMIQNTYKGKPYGEPVSFMTEQQAKDYAKEQVEKGFGIQEIPGTRNFVVFPGEEKSMRILERNGFSGLLAE